MIENTDIEILLKAKKEQRLINVLSTLSVFCLMMIIFLESIEYPHQYTVHLATAGTLFLAFAAGGNKWVVVSRDKLIGTIENIINRDPEALKKLAEMRTNGR